MQAVLNKIELDRQKLHDLVQTLQHHDEALDIAENTLADFDLLAIPFSLDIEAAKEAAKVWEPILRDTAPALLPFVAIQRKLRGEAGQDYKKHYLHMLNELGMRLWSDRVCPARGPGAELRECVRFLHV